jgi:hypothetical protein
VARENAEDIDFICDQCSIAELPHILTDADDSELQQVQSDADQPSMNEEQPALPFECLRRKGLHFLHLNARSVLSKLTDLRQIARTSHPAVLAVSESWLDDSITDEEIKIDGYSIVRRDRNRNGGGVCAYITNNIAFNRREDIATSATSFESLWIDLLLPKMKTITIGACYRPPKNSLNIFNNELQTTLSSFNIDSEIYILGDFNINYSLNQNTVCRTYHDTLSLYNFCQIIDTPTRITTTTSNILDHILCNTPEKICQSGTIDIGISDHMIIFCTRRNVKGIMNVNNVVEIRSMRNYEQEVYIDMLRNANWENVLNDNEVNSAWRKFKDILDHIIDHIAPVKRVKVKSKTEPWMTGEIIEAIKERDKLFSTYRKNPANEQMYESYCRKRNFVQRTVKRAKCEYVSEQIELNRNNSKNLWSHLKRLGYRNKCKDNSKIVLSIDNELCHDSKKVANHINKFFTNIAHC